MYEEKEGIVPYLKTENGYAVESIVSKENALFLYHFLTESRAFFFIKICNDPKVL